MLHVLTDPLAYEFIRYALLMGLLIGGVCPIIGSYLVVQRLTLLGDVIAHALLPGLVLAHFWGIAFILGAFISGMLGTGLITWIRAQSRIKIDAAMALTFASFFALGIVLLSTLNTQLDLDGLLFGDILSVTAEEIRQAVILAVGLLVLVGLFYRPLLFLTFDRLGAEAMGLPVSWLNAGLMAAVTLTLILGMQMVGVILAIALMVGPATTAYLLVKELHQMMLIGSGLGAAASVIGVYLSYYLDLPTGPAIALVVFTLFLLALLFSPSQGIFTQPKLAQPGPNRR
ncbi:metal ABC transporter permease [Romeria aff. gracilis LEGE 07310]|uniref:Metal ABC transporter permease n=1 Tax=Vasconcelosia minhoensis LEGE 07310 TaxID=915328 RepID=A0A8J7AEI2_9CYAN|nr:metal ABC transporter permease [Romeria gracilis]MBE9078176.1 metal ABC transporter permease [Romeria aff. gracilis LEGE 07310]